MTKKVLYISMLCEEDTKEYTSTCGSKEGVQDGKWFAARLADAGLSEDFAVEHMCISRGSEALPSAEQQAQYDVLVLGGTFHNVYDGREWQVPLRQWLVDQRETGRPLLGICGGHQAMCTALGGSVVKRTNGTAAGTFPVALTSDGATHELFKGMADPQKPPAFLFANGDHLDADSLPLCATVLATRPDSAALCVDWGRGWISMQYHPEAHHDTFHNWVSTGVIVPAPAPADAYRESASGSALIANFLAAC